MKKIFSLFVAALFSASMMAVTYTVVGSSNAIFGTSWDKDNTANDMVEADGIYTLTKTNVTCSAGEFSYKAIPDHNWDDNNSIPSGPNASQSYSIEKSGVYDIVFTLTLSPKELKVEATLKSEEEVIPSIAMHGNFSGSWKDSEEFTLAGDKKTASLKLTLAENPGYEFGMRIGGSGNWTSNGASFTRQANSHAITSDSGNLKLAADLAGEYTFTWTFETNTLAVTYPEGQVEVAKFYVTGDSALVVDAGLDKAKAWNPDAIKSTGDTLKLQLKADVDYTLKVSVNGTWVGENNVKGYNELTEKTDGLVDLSKDHNIGFKLKTAGEVKVIYIAGNPEVFKVAGDFVIPEPAPEVPVIKIAGDFNSWTATEMPAADEKTASIKVNLTKAQEWGFKVIVGEKWLTAGEQGVKYQRGGEPIALKYDQGEGNNVFINADVVGEYTITWTYADSTVAVTFPELPEITLADGYYLIGITGWSIYALDASLKFEENIGAEVPEYVLKGFVLTEGQEMKVVEVKDKALGAWYGMKDDKNYVISADVAGTRDIYFRPTYNEAWEGHIYVNWETTAIDNAEVDGKAVKMIENGMLIIRRDGKTYNVLGTMVK